MPPVHADPVHSMYITWPYLVLADNHQAASLIPEFRNHSDPAYPVYAANTKVNKLG